MKKLSLKKHAPVCLLAAAAISLSACTTTLFSFHDEQAVSYDQAFGPLNQSPAQYQELVNNATASSRFNALVLSARSQVAANNISGANAVINTMLSEASNPVEYAEARMMEALLLSRTEQVTQAADSLSRVSPSGLPARAAGYYYVLSSNINQRAYFKTHKENYALQAFSSSRELAAISTGREQLQALQNSVTILNNLPSDRLFSLFVSASGRLDRGFYEYALISASSSDTARASLFQDFRSKYPGHPLLALLDGSAAPAAAWSAPAAAAPAAAAGSVPVTAAAGTAGSGPVIHLKEGARIAVLLPLSGRFAKIVGEPAQLGIMAALQDRSAHVSVSFYDTARDNISDIIPALERNSTALIIGPVLKPEVDALNATNTSIPSIVLNTPKRLRPQKQWFFDLSPNYEGALAASRIHHDGHRNPVIIAADSQKSRRASASFRQVFAAVNSAVPVCTFTEPGTIRSTLASCPLANADAVYINAGSVDAVTIKGVINPQLPVYLTDQSYEGYNHSTQEFALKDALLGDMPWLLTDSPLKDSFMQSMPKADAQVQRIFAAGYDAVSFAFNLEALTASPGEVLHGLTGDITPGRNGLIESSPMWVKLGIQQR